jgi:IclR family KDG regulon transcriptional repressor
MSDEDARPYYYLSTVGRAMAVLEQFCGNEAQLGVSDIARKLGLHKGVTHRMLMTLVDLHYLAPGAQPGTYRLGVKSLELGLSYLRHSPIDRVAQTHLQRLALVLPEMAFHVAILNGSEIVYQKSIVGPDAAWVSGTLGRRQQAYCTALGKVLLAYLSPSELQTYLSRVELRPLTSKTITDPETLVRELEQVRKCGYAMDNEETYPAHMCVGGPIRDHTGSVVAALSLAGLTEHFTEHGLEHLVEIMRKVAAAISRDLGFVMLNV